MRYGVPVSACIVVTGATGGFGPALVRLLVGRGDRVAAIGSPRSAEAVRALEKELGTACVGIAMDVTSPGAWKEALPRIERQIAPPWGAALVAGGWKGGERFDEEQDDAVWQSMMTVNLETARQSLRALLPGMIARGTGSIVVIGSRVAERPWVGASASAYTAAKSAVVALGRAVAAEIAPRGVRVNAVLPGTIDTPANRASMPSADRSHWVSAESLARVVGFFLSDASRDITGAALPVYGETG